MSNRAFTLARIPDGVPGPEDFRLETLNAEPLADGRVRVRTLIWGVDPGLRARLTRKASYTAGLQVGDIVSGFVAGEVVESRSPAFQAGDIVQGAWGWREMADVAPEAISPAPERGPLPLAALLGLLGVPGVTAWFGITEIGAVKPGEEVLVTAAAGGVGSIAAQVAKLKGARVVGLAGGPEKCAWLRDGLKLDDVIDYKGEPDLKAALRRAFPKGIDVVFENLGNAMIDALLPRMRPCGRIVVCGVSADLNTPAEERYGVRNIAELIGKRLRLEGFVALDYRDRYHEAWDALRAWAAAGELVTREHIAVGFENLPTEFASLFGENALGRKLVAAG